MMSLQSKLQKIQDALTAIEGLPVYHYWRSAADLTYCIWEEESDAGILAGDNHTAEQAISGYIELFTKTEFDPYADAIQEALNAVEGCAWLYEGAVYEEDSNLIHHSWVWEVI